MQNKQEAKGDFDDASQGKPRQTHRKIFIMRLRMQIQGPVQQ